MITKNDLKNLLQNQIVQIEFLKKDGSKRIMQCSLKREFLPKNTDENLKKSPKKENLNTLAVWDLNKSAFRSFRIDSIQNYSVIREGYEL